jgi:hypothetical protein
MLPILTKSTLMRLRQNLSGIIRMKVKRLVNLKIYVSVAFTLIQVELVGVQLQLNHALNVIRRCILAIPAQTYFAINVLVS